MPVYLRARVTDEIQRGESSSSRKRKLILSADDFGMSPGVNRGIIRAHREGVLTAASLMVNGAAFEEAVDLARANPELGVGLHLVLVQGRSTTAPGEIPALVDAAGHFGTHPIWCGMRYFFQPGVRAQLRREIESQLEKFAATGLPLSHVDGHLTIHMHPVVNDILIDLAAPYGIRAMRLPRDPLVPALRFDRRYFTRKTFEATVFNLLSRRAAARLAASGIRHSDRTYGLHQTGQISEDYLLHVVRDLPPGVTELYGHVAEDDEEAQAWRPPHYDSAGELRGLTSPRVRDAIAAADIELSRYRDLSQSSDHTGPRTQSRVP
jgi:hopanoid biosynthesis associated protein HpnK